MQFARMVKILLLLLAINKLEGAKILGFFPNLGYSQFLLGDALMSELATRGHEVTMISSFLPKEDRYRTVLLNISKPECFFACYLV
ncbi:unnamed protein product, partial [Callosobruchus maculatus]